MVSNCTMYKISDTLLSRIIFDDSDNFIRDGYQNDDHVRIKILTYKTIHLVVKVLILLITDRNQRFIYGKLFFNKKTPDFKQRTIKVKKK